jgi:DNA uptake protein ComE-like DNA-binding protein
MTRTTFVSTLAAALVGFVVFGGAPVRGQVGQGLVDFNTATAEQLAALPNMTPAAVKAITRYDPDETWRPAQESGSS